MPLEPKASPQTRSFPGTEQHLTLTWPLHICESHHHLFSSPGRRPELFFFSTPQLLYFFLSQAISCQVIHLHFHLFSKYLLGPFHKSSLVAQTVKCLLTTRETWVRSLGWEDLLEKEMATHSSILAWKIPWTEEPGRLQSMGLQRVGHDWATFTLLLLYFRKPGTVFNWWTELKTIAALICTYIITCWHAYSFGRGFQSRGESTTWHIT